MIRVRVNNVKVQGLSLSLSLSVGLGLGLGLGLRLGLGLGLRDVKQKGMLYLHVKNAYFVFSIADHVKNLRGR